MIEAIKKEQALCFFNGTSEDARRRRDLIGGWGELVRRLADVADPSGKKWGLAGGFDDIETACENCNPKYVTL